MNDIEKTQQKIIRSDLYALKNIELLMPEQMTSQFTSRLHVKAVGNSMLGVGIYPDDLLIVDRSLQARNGHLVLAELFGQLTLKRLHVANGKTTLMSENSEYKSILVTAESNFKVLGVLIVNIHKHA